MRHAFWFRSYDSSHTLDLGLVVLNVKYDRDHPHQWFGWTAMAPGIGCCFARRESLRRYSTAKKARTAAETWARKRIESSLRTLVRLARG